MHLKVLALFMLELIDSCSIKRVRSCADYEVAGTGYAKSST